ncbi:MULTISPECIES: 2-dehydro-3-deoxy-6-phosphogalactonate aldolase [unclassified Duganella]|uniref:2-dehydro-3-deoxy-6-phosphogalactonate aldolase n=1 Tax=unclassified Duganella TaxID=2636909 RepID=UPI000700FCDB|nr:MULTISPECIES: 2-dehydro-3-deoxy-6-phosphogalactonate aldolase [unclassified Duganella]KQV45241.1 2-dehydro-3-deoxy-6-phosphogalactonate aldolase [Duganella sp. Root336D2]KRC02841.1 2-dehydro-3-deoxy-6-phosphogalactonate aldolase [Duganella sp. Root198D2]
MNATSSPFESAFRALPLVAILRGVQPHEVEAIGAALYEAGFRLIEVPLNSPQPLDSIARLARSLPDDAVLGAGTVLTATAVQQVRDSGGALIVMPHSDTAVIRAAKAAGMYCVPGAATPTEAFAAAHAGADALKLFPAELVTPNVMRAMRAVLPPALPLLPVGGVTPGSMATWRAAGATGFGLGSALYQPGLDAAAVAERARSFVSAWRQDGTASPA